MPQFKIVKGEKEEILYSLSPSRQFCKVYIHGEPEEGQEDGMIGFWLRG